MRRTKMRFGRLSHLRRTTRNAMRSSVQLGGKSVSSVSMCLTSGCLMRGCWVEIKGRSPTREELSLARKLVSSTGEPVHLLWGNIPDPQAHRWGECVEVYLGDMNII